jgi:hypothetical protein
MIVEKRARVCLRVGRHMHRKTPRTTHHAPRTTHHAPRTTLYFHTKKIFILIPHYFVYQFQQMLNFFDDSTLKFTLQCACIDESSILSIGLVCFGFCIFTDFISVFYFWAISLCVIILHIPQFWK